jgi:hypothetical protein
MNLTGKSVLDVELSTEEQRGHLADLAQRRNWGLALVLVGWLHLAAFVFCYYLTIVENYHEAAGYLLVWAGELCGVWLIFRACAGRRPAAPPPGPLEILVRRVWLAYFVLAFNLGSLNTLRGHKLFEFFPAIAPLASFAFLLMAMLVNQRFFGAVLVMFGSGLLMAAHLLHAYFIFAVAWWLVLSCTGWALWRRRHRGTPRLSTGRAVRGASSPAARPSGVKTQLPGALAELGGPFIPYDP